MSGPMDDGSATEPVERELKVEPGSKFVGGDDEGQALLKAMKVEEDEEDGGEDSNLE